MKMALALCVGMMCCAANSHASTSQFDVAQLFSADTKHFVKWNGMRDRYDQQRGFEPARCSEQMFHPCRAEAMKSNLLRWKTMRAQERLRAINEFGNTHPYVTDSINWAVEDFWATPIEFVVKNGDCEDYAITKYFALRLVGTPAEKLRIIIVQDMNLGGVVHAVLGVLEKPDKLMILDNQIGQVVDAKTIYHYRPIYAINEHGWWAYTPRS